jgi:poly(3-hydroxybutyrate) depolymerase
MVLLICASLLAVPTWANEAVTRSTFDFNGRSRSYYFFAPNVDQPWPLVVLLHGRAGNGKSIARSWKGLAAKNHFIIVAPDALNPSTWDTNADPPAFLHALVYQVAATHPVDRDRIYLYGYQGGGVYALALALIDAEYFAATAANAGALRPQDYGLFSLAKRKMPIAVWVGKGDMSPRKNIATDTRNAFRSRGFPIEFNVALDHDKLGYEWSWDDVNWEAWQFLRQKQLSQPTGSPAAD